MSVSVFSDKQSEQYILFFYIFLYIFLSWLNNQNKIERYTLKSLAPTHIPVYPFPVHPP